MKKRDLTVISADVYLAGVKWQKSSEKDFCPFTGFSADKCEVCAALFPGLSDIGEVTGASHPDLVCPCDAYPLSYVRRVIKGLESKIKSQSQMPSWL